MREWFQVTNAAPGKGGGEILVYGVIGRSSWGDKDGYVPAKELITALDAMIAAGPGDVHIRINSPGGDVWDGTAIYNGILKHKSRCYCTVEGVAFSMASVIALAGRECRMYETGQFMIHNPKTFAYGEEKDFEQTLRQLRNAKAALMKAYTGKSGKSPREVSDAMTATTWMTAEEAKEFGFVDVVLTDEAPSIAACFDTSEWRAYYEGGGVGVMISEVGFFKDEAPPCPPGGSATGDSGGDEDGTPGEEHESENNGGDAPKEEAVMKMTELKAACPGASAEFLNTQMEACEKDEKRTITDVVTAFAVEQTKALTEARAALVEAQNKPAETPAPVTVPGVAPLSASGGSDESGGTGDPLEDFEAAVSAHEAKKMTRAQAIRAVVNGQPELHKAYLRAYNAQHGRGMN